MVIVIVGTIIWHHSMTEIAIVMVVATSSVCAGMLVVAWGHAEGSRASLVERANLALLDADLDLTVVVPYYNPGQLLVPTIERLLSVLDASGATYEVIAVSDGSTDGSDRELDDALARQAPAHQRGAGAQPGQGGRAAGRPGQGPWPLPRLHRRRWRPRPDPVRLVPDDGAPLQPRHNPREQAPPALRGRVPVPPARLLVGLPAGRAPRLPAEHP